MNLSSIVCVATQKYQWMLWPYALLLWKYWGRDIQIVYYGDKTEGKLPPGVTFRQVPLMREKSEGHWDWVNYFGDGFASILRELSDPIVAITLPDMWLVNYAHLDVIDLLTEYMETHPRVVHAAMCRVCSGGPDTRCVETWGGIDIMTCLPTNSFQGGLMLEPALWNRELALEIITNRGIWNFELMGKEAMDRRPDLMSVWVQFPPDAYPYAHVSFRAEAENLHLWDIPREEDRKVIEAFIPEHIVPVDTPVREGHKITL